MLVRRHPLLTKFLQRYARFFGYDIYQYLLFFARVGYWPKFNDPKSFNEKICWLKFNYKNPKMSLYSDKLFIRRHVEKLCHNIRIPKIYFVSSDPESITFSDIPDRCVIKSNHASGQVMFYERGVTSEIELVNICQQWLSSRYGNLWGEWAYRDIKPMIYGEEFLCSADGKVPNDYKVIVLNGMAEFVQVDYDRFGSHTRDCYDTNWNRLDVVYGYSAGRGISKPRRLQEMLDAAEKIAGDLPFIRVDFYVIGGDIYFGEVCFYPVSGMGPFIPEHYDWKFGAALELPCDFTLQSNERR